jgi:hypothetical protein
MRKFLVMLKGRNVVLEFRSWLRRRRGNFGFYTTRYDSRALSFLSACADEKNATATAMKAAARNEWIIAGPLSGD